MDFRTRLLYYLYKHRVNAIEKYKNNAELLQKQQLSVIIKSAVDTTFAKEYLLREDFSYFDFSDAVPVHTYDRIKPYIEEMIEGKPNILHQGVCKWFAKSSGTTNDKSKFIPVPQNYLNNCHYRGGQDVLALYLRNNPKSKLGSTKALVLGGSHAPVSLGSKARTGDLSAILIQNMPFVGELIRVPSKETLLMGEWNAKMEAIVKEVANKNVGSFSGVPSWMLVMVHKVLEYTGKSNILEVWPNMEVFFHGGISFEPYRKTYEGLIPSERMHYMETYNASEGFFAIQDDPDDKGMLLMLDYGVYYEFVPLSDLDETQEEVCSNASPIPIWEVEKCKTYAMLITTLGGLYRYLIGDTVKFTSVSPYKIVITGRTKQYINAFGEELMVANAEKAIAKTSSELGIKVKDFTAAPEFFTDKAKGRHQWLVEIEEDYDVDVNMFADLLDKNLQELNSDYEAKRYSDMTLYRLNLIVVPSGFFHSWLDAQGKLGGQHKIPRLCNNRQYIDSMLSLLDKYTSGKNG